MLFGFGKYRIGPVSGVSVWIALVTLTLLSACTARQVNRNVSPGADAALDAAYQEATAMAKNPTPEKVFEGLVAIVPENTDLDWNTINGERYVLMSTYTSTFEYYQDYLGKTYNTGKYDIWVTASPFVRNLCQDPNWSDGNLDLRLEQLLGLPPNGNRVGFAEFWVKPQDLFRPCPDNEVTDETCGLNLPEDTEPAYRAWFNDLRAIQYFFCPPDKKGYPWTQLGYTFDWKDLAKPVGMSEFVIRQNADIIVHRLVDTQKYCSSE